MAAYRVLLISQDEGSTLLIQEEDYGGFYIWFWNANAMEPIYSKVNQSLAEYVGNK